MIRKVSFDEKNTMLPKIIIFITSLFFLPSQTQRAAHRDGCPSDWLRSQRAVSFLHPRGRVRVAQGARRVLASVGPRRRSVQLVLSLEGHRRVHQHVLLVPGVRHAARRPSAQVLQGRERVVAGRGCLHDQLVARARPHAFAESAKYLRRKSSEDTIERLFRRGYGEFPCVLSARQHPVAQYSTNNSDSSKIERCREEVERYPRARLASNEQTRERIDSVVYDKCWTELHTVLRRDLGDAWSRASQFLASTLAILPEEGINKILR